MLRVVPSCLVVLHVQLDIGALIEARYSNRLTCVIDARIGKRSAGNARQSIGFEVARCTCFRNETGVVANLMESHGNLFHGSSVFVNLLGLGHRDCFGEIKTRVLFNVRSARDDVPRQAAVKLREERRMRRAMAGDCRDKEWIAGVGGDCRWETDLPVDNAYRAGYRSHDDRGQWHQCGNG
jgi:hypothetical protein